MNLPFLTGELSGIGGSIKQRPEDFFVQEIPLYEPSGQGEHVYCEIEKMGITTFDAIDRVAQALNVNPRDVGYAGLKDAHAITRQIFSIAGTTESAVMDLHLPKMSVQWAARHGNKLRLGHLRGNRFAVKIRDVNPTDVVKLTPLVRRLQDRGMPNYFGEQRFGRRGNNHLLGAALLRGDDQAVLKLLLGSPNPALDDPRQRAAREAFDRNDLAGSMKLWPRSSGMERRILARLIKTQNPAAAVRAVDQRIRRLWISSLQSEMFNAVVARRIQSLDKLLSGDLAEKQDNGAVFRVEDVTAEQPRCDAFEISPTGPLIGYRMTDPESEALQIEQAVFASRGIRAADFRVAGRLKVKGARRPLRVRPADVELAAGVDEHGPHVTVAFTLPAGSFATVFLRELMKVESQQSDGS
ncbi:MAG TPA: tRNA pseudouridine(13) synthase TruD [Tepidisphaeraceae bacterium]|jgi:tRNA pseudouridine13 synthase|nr:tRNA pseudouridine(13) synthase TruD [Tepidisphaeraceae bacterium]